METSMKKIHDALVNGIRTYFRKHGFTRAVLGLSGGVDSAVCATLAAEALGSKNVTAILMPEKGLTKKTNVHDAAALAKKLHIMYYVVPINDAVKAYAKLPWEQNHLSKINLKPRIRANILYNFANMAHALVIGTGNKSEAMMGYGTKHGDLACDLYVIGGLYKTEVFALAKELGVPKIIISKKPTAELYHGQTDEGELGHSYTELDAMLKRKDKRLMGRVKMNAHKMKFPYVVKV